MFVLSRNVSASFRVIATLVAAAVVLWAMGAYHYAEAANITSVSDVLSDSDKGVDSSHTITFTLPTSLVTGEAVVVNFDQANGFDFTGVTSADFTITATGGTFSKSVDTTLDKLVATSTGGTVATGTVVTIIANGTNKINNPSPADGNESYEIDISAGTDSGHTRVVILDNVLVTAVVETTFDFTVYGNGASEPVNGTSTTLTSSSTTIPFGVLTAGSIETLSQDLTVRTNAINGFVVTVHEDQHLQSSTGADIDNFDDSVITNPAAWNSPSNNISNENTWGHWGMTTEDATTTRVTEFGNNQWLGVSTTPTVIFSHNGPADAVTPGTGSTTIGYQIEISPLQEAGDDYNTILTYIATPTF
jgi:hypothetical protein